LAIYEIRIENLNPKHRGAKMKRKIGLLTAVLFALTLTSQTILALDHDPFDPIYNGGADIVATTEGDPWAELNNKPNDDDEITITLWNGALIIIKNMLTQNIYTPPVIIIFNENQNKNDRSENEETGSQDVREGSTPPSNM